MKRYEYSSVERELMETSLVPFAIYQFIDRRVVTIVLSAGFLRLFGYDDPDEAYFVMDNNMYEDTHPDDAARIADAAFEFATKGGRYETVYRSKKRGCDEYEIIHAQGEHFYTKTGERLAIVWYTDEGAYAEKGHAHSRPLNGQLTDVIHEFELLKSNYYDHLTGLPSMAYFFDLADAAARRMKKEGRRPAVIFADLSGMKYYNQKHGFAKGNQLLREFAGMLSRFFSNESCSRFGSDHFAVITEDSDLDRRLERFISEWNSREDETPPVRFGIYGSFMDDEDMVTACDRAKLACDTDRNVLDSHISRFDGEMLENTENRQYIIENLDRALEERWIQVYYQPIVRSTNDRICDEEALARWIDPEKGMLSPLQFVPILEDAGLIYKLDLYILDRVIENITLSEKHGIRIVPQSINLSRTDFDSCDIVEEIRKRVDASGYERSLFTIEITESTVAKNLDFMKEQIGRFHELGFSVWMDDFGSGYSSLDVLQGIPFDLIKFDMHFMRQFDESENGKIILSELMKMAASLGVDTLCEGVEREDQLEFLKTIGCSRIQGYYYGKPVSLEEIFRMHDLGEYLEYENPEEAGYFNEIGRINLHDLAVISNREDSSLRHYFNTLPMAIVELAENNARFIRKNRSYQMFMCDTFGLELDGTFTDFDDIPKGPGRDFMRMIESVCSRENRTIVDELLPDNTVAHLFIRRIADNHVTGVTAFAIAVLAVTADEHGASYENIARTLASDYFNLFHVDLKTGDFIEYSSMVGEHGVAVERHGKDFFNAARKDALKVIYKDDVNTFLNAFRKENILKAIQDQGSFSLGYRLLIEGRPVYVNMKGVLMRGDSDYIIFGVSNVDAQMQQRRLVDRLRQEHMMYNRVNALLGDFLVMYTVDPETEKYIETTVNNEYSSLGLSKSGEDFFSSSIRNGKKVVAPFDMELYEKELTKENVMRTIEEEGVFTMKYHLMIDGEPKLVKLRAAMVEEEKKHLIIGVNFIKD